jgi:hypothetical protein
LETVFLDVVPDFFGELAAGDRGGADDGRKNGVRLNGFEEGGIGFAFRFGCCWHVGWFFGCDTRAVRLGVNILEDS